MKFWNLKYVPFLIFTAIISLTGSCTREELHTNILLILADDVGRETLECYGGSSYDLPEINALAEKGMLLEHVYAAPLCHPSRVEILTGQYPGNVGNPGWGSFAPEAETMTFAHELKKAGYKTAVAGKWQLATLKDDTDQPHRLGFDEYCLFGWHEGPRYHVPLIWQNGKIRDDVRDQYGPDVYSDFLIEFMKKNREQPFLAYYPMALIHDVTNDLDGPPPFGLKGRYENVAEMLVEMDRVVGKMIQALADMGLDQNTLIIFVTDNGTNPNSILTYEEGEYIKEKVFSEYKGMHIPGGKGKFTDWGVRIPGIAVWPGKIVPGSRNSDLIDFSDFLPTLLELLELPEQEFEIDGKSFAPALRGEEYVPREWVYSERNQGERYMVRTREWKLLWTGELFDMKADEYEKSPIRQKDDSPRSSAARAELKEILEEIRE